jgi:hypothetical protein
MRRSVRAADGAGLENQWTAMSHGFESHGLRQPKPEIQSRVLSFLDYLSEFFISENKATSVLCQQFDLRTDAIGMGPHI